MKDIAILTDKDRSDLFRNTAARSGMADPIIEKDFWVCYMLDYLFHRSPWKNAMTFKGGTSLSKAYHLIDRFSEDIDLILDWRILGYGRNEPWLQRSNTKQDLFNKEANAKAAAFLSEIFAPKIQEDICAELGKKIPIFIAPDDPQTVIFAYPRLFKSNSTLQVIRLEIGALAAWSPSSDQDITPYAAEAYPLLFSHPTTAIRTVDAERTFWEKATILHHEANRPENLNMPPRYSRHYYDLFQMYQTPVKENAFSQLELLKNVVDFKMKFYPRKWADYSSAVPQTIKLSPPSYRLRALNADYRAMQDMLFGRIPSFDEILISIQKLEEEIHSLQPQM